MMTRKTTELDSIKLWQRLKGHDESKQVQTMFDQLAMIWYLGFTALAGALILWLMKKGLIG